MKSRSINILKKLLKATSPIKANKLSKIYDVSHRTIRNDMQEINAYLQQLNISEVESIRNRGYQLSITSEQKQIIVKNLYQSDQYYLSPKERILDLLFSIAFTDYKIFLNKKEKKFMVSKSTIDEDIRQLRTKVKKYDVEIISFAQQGLKLIGSERNIRLMLFDLINREVGLINISDIMNSGISPLEKILYTYLPVSEIKTLNQIVNLHLNDINGDIYKKQIILFLLIWLKRVQINETIDAPLKIESKQSITFIGFIEQIEKQFNLHISEVERSYITLILNSFKTTTTIDTFEWTHIQLFIIYLIKHVEKDTKIPFTKEDKDLFEGLYQHIIPFMKRVSNNIQLTNPLTSVIKKNYSKIFKSIKSFLRQHFHSDEIIDDEIAFLTIHFSSAAIKINKMLELSFKCVVICNQGLATGNLLAANLKEKFPELDIVAVLSHKEIGLIKKMDVDLIFTTISIENNLSIPMLKLNPILDEHAIQLIGDFLESNDYLKRNILNEHDQNHFFNEILKLIIKSKGKVNQRIYNNLKQIFEENNLKINTKEIFPMLEDVLTDNKVLINKRADNWQEAIELAAQPLLKEGYIKSSYIEAMIEAVEEHGPYIVLGKHLALPHARPEEGVNQLGVSVATFPDGVNFGHEELDPVKIVFCLAATDSYSHLNIMKELVSLINDSEKLEKLINSKKVEEFKKIIFD